MLEWLKKAFRKAFPTTYIHLSKAGVRKIVTAISIWCFVAWLELLVVVFSPTDDMTTNALVGGIVIIFLYIIIYGVVKTLKMAEKIFNDISKWPLHRHCAVITLSFITLILVVRKIYQQHNYAGRDK
jgi:hypothetical protein